MLGAMRASVELIYLKDVKSYI